MMRGNRYLTLGLSFFLLLTAALSAQKTKPELLSIPEIKQFVPAVYFFRGQSATVQIRNAAGFHAPGEGKLVMAALVDTSGYSHDVAEKYQGLLITEVKLTIGGSDLPPGQYGFGFTDDGKFRVMDVGANDLFLVAANADETLRRPVPLKMAEDNGSFRLYEGKKWVLIKLQ